jgi:DNA repair protein RecO (recombination protein O)
MLTKTKGIVLRKLNYGETSLIVDVFTEEHGLMSYIIGGVRQAKSRGGSALLQLMAVVELVAYHSEKSKLHRIKEVHAAHVFQSVPGDVRKNAIILFLAELCSKVIRQTERNKELYQMIEDAITTLDRAQEHFADTHLLFMIRLADLMGFGPEERKHAESSFFDLLDGRFTSSSPDHEYYVREPDLFNQYLIAARQQGVKNVSSDRITRNRMLDTLLLYFQLHIDKMPEIHGHKVLREIL